MKTRLTFYPMFFLLFAAINSPLSFSDTPRFFDREMERLLSLLGTGETIPYLDEETLIQAAPIEALEIIMDIYLESSKLPGIVEIRLIDRFGVQANALSSVLFRVIEKSTYSYHRKMAVSALDSINPRPNKKALSQLVRSLKKESDTEVKIQMARTLSNWGYKADSIRAELKKQLAKEPNEIKQKTLLLALSDLENTPETAEPKVMEKPHEGLKQESITDLFRKLKTASGDERQIILDTLKELGPKTAEILPQLLVILKDKNSSYKDLADAIKIIGFMKERGTKALPALLDILKFSNDAYIESMAIESIAQMKNEAKVAIPDLIFQIETNPNIWIRSEAVSALKTIGKLTPQVLSTLRNNYKNERHTEIRNVTADVLASFGAEAAAAAPDFIHSLKYDSNKEIKSQAAKTLGKMKSPQAISQLLDSAQTDPADTVRHEAMNALTEIGVEEKILPDLRTLATHGIDTQTRIFAVRLLGSIGKTMEGEIPLLIEITKNKNTELAAAAIECLGRIATNSEEAKNRLLQIVLDHAYISFPTLGEKAAEALGNFGKSASSTTPTLLEIFTSPYLKVPSFRFAVGQTLVKIDKADPELAIVPKVIEHLRESPIESVRCAAAKTLGLLSPTDETLSELVSSLKKEATDVRKCAAEGLITMGEFAAPMAHNEMFNIVKNEFEVWHLRQSIATRLAQIDDKSIINFKPELDQILQSFKTPKRPSR